MSYECIRIETATNGFTVQCTDPEIRKANDKPGSKYRDSSRSYVFKEWGQVLKFLKSIGEKALPKDEHTSSFDAAFSKASGEDEKD